MTKTKDTTLAHDLPAARPTRTELGVDQIQPDDQNRGWKRDDDWTGFVDSIRAAGILQALSVQHRTDGTYLLIDGHRRLRGATEAGLVHVPCDVWPSDVLVRDTVVAGVILNEHRKAHGVLQLARRLRQVKNQFAESQASLASRTGIPLPRVKLYLGLFDASDFLLDFFEDADLTLTLAVQFARFEKDNGEVEARRLVRRHEESPLTVRDIELLREKRAQRQADAKETTEVSRTRRGGFSARIEAAFRRDPEGARRELEDALERLGLRLATAEAG